MLIMSSHSSPLGNLEGKKFLITGASGGIGQAIAKIFYQSHATIGLTGTREALLREFAQSLGPRAFPLPTRLTDSQSCNALLDQATETMGGLDGLINNAGITRDQLTLRMTDEAWNEVLHTNLTCTFYLSRYAAKTMMKRKTAGRIINITSVVGHTGNKGQANYVASKAGVTGLTKVLALEFASRQITVNAIAPGFIRTPMTDQLSESAQEAILSQIPLKNLGVPEDVAYGALFLASAQAQYVTGQTLHINGGMAMTA